MPNWAVPPLPTRLSAIGDPPFVGRHHELERLEGVWERVERGERQAVFLGGEPGSGKSRIAAEMARALHGRETVVLLGTTSPDLGYPYQPLVEALDHLLEASEPGSLSDVIPDSAAELLRLTPNVRHHRPDLVEPDPTQQEYRRELFAAYVDLVRSIGSERPLALVLEDVHWASAPTRLLMSYLIENTTDLPLLVLATMRTTSPDRSDDLAFMIADLYRLKGVTRFDLAGLDTEDIEEYLARSVGRRDSDLREAAVVLRDQTGGNPFFLREMWRDLSGDLANLRAGRIPAPRSVSDTLQRRIQSLEGLGRQALEHGAVLGAEFAESDIVASVDEAQSDVQDTLDSATKSGLLDTAGRGRYSFQHALIRQTLLDDLSSSRSAQIHARLAEVIEPRYEQDPSVAPLLARLFDGAGTLIDTEKTRFYLVEAAHAARRGLAHEEAADLYEQAARSSTTDTRTREELLLSAARAHLSAGGFPEARRIFSEVTESSNPRIALEAAIGYEDASWRPGLPGDDSRLLLETSLQGIEPDESDPIYVSAITALARAHNFSGDIEASSQLGHRAIEMARGLGDDSLLADALVGWLLRVITSPGLDAETYELSVELRDLASKLGDYERFGPAGAMKASNGYLRSDREAFVAGRHDIGLAAAKTGQPFWEWVEGCFRHCTEFMAGEFQMAANTARRINELGYSFGAEQADGPFGLQMYLVQRETGGLEEVRELITGDPNRDGTWTPGLLSLYTELDMKEPVRALMPASLELPRTIDSRAAIYPAVLAFLSDAALFIQQIEAIERLLPHMQGFDGSNLMVGQSVAALGSANTYLGRMHTALGHLEEGERHFRRGLEMDIAIGSITHQALTLAYYADLVDRAGDPDRAVDYRARARQLADPIGQKRVITLVDKAAGGKPDGLTSRELEVLRLLVEGASNREIGERLFISPNTAANHVRSILVKTASPNRTAAAIYAKERRLL